MKADERRALDCVYVPVCVCVRLLIFNSLCFHISISRCERTEPTEDVLVPPVCRRRFDGIKNFRSKESPAAARQAPLIPEEVQQDLRLQWGRDLKGVVRVGEEEKGETEL